MYNFVNSNVLLYTFLFVRVLVLLEKFHHNDPSKVNNLSKTHSININMKILLFEILCLQKATPLPLTFHFLGGEGLFLHLPQ